MKLEFKGPPEQIVPDIAVHVLEHLPEIAVIVIDAQANIVYANNQAMTLFGYDPVELIGEPIALLIPDAQSELHAKYVTEYLKAPVPRPMGSGLTIYGKRKSGAEIHLDISLSAMDDAEMGTLGVAIIRKPQVVAVALP
jgi:PAS domain S-box-containing protein